mmetsp:Transcript_94731/g.296232  ORF Transcript_94731/g.296232 Transcript_94731/m.296232 type:complete len:238 (+) Transcript_94731:34-747(+)
MFWMAWAAAPFARVPKVQVCRHEAGALPTGGTQRGSGSCSARRRGRQEHQQVLEACRTSRRAPGLGHAWRGRLPRSSWGTRRASHPRLLRRQRHDCPLPRTLGRLDGRDLVDASGGPESCEGLVETPRSRWCLRSVAAGRGPLLRGHGGLLPPHGNGRLLPSAVDEGPAPPLGNALYERDPHVVGTSCSRGSRGCLWGLRGAPHQAGARGMRGLPCRAPRGGGCIPSLAARGSRACA